MKKVSVVVPCYNAAKYLDKCVGKLLNQTIGRDAMEIILVDDASTDAGETWKLITEYEQRFPDTVLAVKLEQNLRQGGARNVGISCAGGEYVLFCDADDWLLEETLEHSYLAARRYDADVVEFAGTNVRDRQACVELEAGNGSRLFELDSEKKRKDFLLYVNENVSLGSQTKLYRLSLIREHQIAFVEHMIFEEPSFVIPVRLYEKRHVFLDEKLYVWYLSQGSTLRSDWEKEHKWENLQAWVCLMENLPERGILSGYYRELEYLFFNYGLAETIRMLKQRGCSLQEEELRMMIDITRELFPDIRQNTYVSNSENGDVWSRLAFRLLQL